VKSGTFKRYLEDDFHYAVYKKQSPDPSDAASATEHSHLLSAMVQ